MKKIIIPLILFFAIIIFNKKYNSSDEYIRVRIIANSNSEYDQKIKNEVKKNVYNDLLNLTYKKNNIDQVRNEISKNLDKIDEDISKTLSFNNYNKNYTLNYGYNYFPEKQTYSKKYSAGYYESLVITLGDGLGDNWWCILFPPLCDIEAEDTKSEKIEYTSFFHKLFSKIL